MYKCNALIKLEYMLTKANKYLEIIGLKTTVWTRSFMYESIAIMNDYNIS